MIRTWGLDRGISGDVHVLACEESPRVSSVTARGWKAYRTDDPLEDDPPAVAFHCPDCSTREFGGWRRNVQGS